MNRWLFELDWLIYTLELRFVEWWAEVRYQLGICPDCKVRRLWNKKHDDCCPF